MNAELDEKMDVLLERLQNDEGVSLTPTEREEFMDFIDANENYELDDFRQEGLLVWLA